MGDVQMEYYTIWSIKRPILVKRTRKFGFHRVSGTHPRNVPLLNAK